MSAPELALGTTADDIVGGYRQLLSKRLLVLLLLAAIIVGSLLLDFTIGPSGLTLAELWQTLLQREAADPATAVIVWDIRLPYALIAVAAGLDQRFDDLHPTGRGIEPGQAADVGAQFCCVGHGRLGDEQTQALW